MNPLFRDGRRFDRWIRWDPVAGEDHVVPEEEPARIEAMPCTTQVDGKKSEFSVPVA